MKRNMRYQLISTIAVTATLLTGCDVKDPIYNTSHPEKGTVTLAPGRIDEDGNKIYDGYTYTLVPLNNGEVTPGDL